MLEMRLEELEQLKQTVLGAGGDDVPQDEQVVEELRLLDVEQLLLEGVDVVEGVIQKDFMFVYYDIMGRLIIINHLWRCW